MIVVVDLKFDFLMFLDLSTPTRSVAKDTPGLPKASRRQPSWDSVGSGDSPMGSPNHKSKSSRRRHKHKESSGSSSPKGESSSNSQSLPNIPKKSRRKKSKDGDGSNKTSSKSKEKGSKHGSRNGSDDGSLTKQYNGEASSSLPSLKEEDATL